MVFGSANNICWVFFAWLLGFGGALTITSLSRFIRIVWAPWSSNQNSAKSPHLALMHDSLALLGLTSQRYKDKCSTSRAAASAAGTRQVYPMAALPGVGVLSELTRNRGVAPFLTKLTSTRILIIRRRHTTLAHLRDSAHLDCRLFCMYDISSGSSRPPHPGWSNFHCFSFRQRNQSLSLLGWQTH